VVGRRVRSMPAGRLHAAPAREELPADHTCCRAMRVVQGAIPAHLFHHGSNERRRADRYGGARGVQSATITMRYKRLHEGQQRRAHCDVIFSARRAEEVHR